ncbi:MAG: hypothetical protein N4A44_04040 [Alphaproteobacteria bacterium]|jgi:hypothetical protein|nr:hypothetical protein [Alphaproteobacteria bacterium]
MKHIVEEVNIELKHLFLFDLSVKDISLQEFSDKRSVEIQKSLKPYFPSLFVFLKKELNFNAPKVSYILKYMILNGANEVMMSPDDGGEFAIELKYKKGARKYLTDLIIVCKRDNGFKKKFEFRFGAKREGAYAY